jgi:3-oxoacyl-[acyl-carrier protein] reductase
LEEAGATACFLAQDLRDPAAGGRLTDFAIRETGRIDIIVNNAGATKRGNFADLTDADWQDGFELKLFGAVRLTRAAWPHLKASSGSVVNIAGSGGRTPGAEFAVGGSVNAAMLSMTKALAELGLKDGVQVNAINPGPVRTDRLTKRLAAYASEQAFVEAERMMRVGEPEEVAGLVAFLVGPEGRLLHGSLIDADCGATKTI